jgi:hypothetical protein
MVHGLFQDANEAGKMSRGIQCDHDGKGTSLRAEPVPCEAKDTNCSGTELENLSESHGGITGTKMRRKRYHCHT